MHSQYNVSPNSDAIVAAEALTSDGPFTIYGATFGGICNRTVLALNGCECEAHAADIYAIESDGTYRRLHYLASETGKQVGAALRGWRRLAHMMKVRARVNNAEFEELLIELGLKDPNIPV